MNLMMTGNLILSEKADRVVAFGAHPDDLEIGAGGLLARLAARGAKVTMVVVSIPNRSKQRYLEAVNGAKTIGAKLLVLYKKPCHVEDIKMYELVQRFDDIIEELKPDLVVAHSDKDLHWDHGLVNRAVISALRRTPCDLLTYLSSPLMNAQARSFGTCFVDITAYMETKLAAISCHKSQLKNLGLDSSRDLARALGQISGAKYAEAYESLRVQI
ncbi:PIG-L family deacetylase [Candidatus Pacearchaeota archaeon]|nr:PIG-L family deacetylase [Candidatus Pacearchaeota archaeon]